MTITHVVFIVLGLLALAYAYFGMSRSRLAARKRAPEASVEQQSRIEPTPAPTADVNEVHAALGQGETVSAIKAYREATGVGQLDAKQAVDRIAEGGPATQVQA